MVNKMNLIGIAVVLTALAYEIQCQECPARNWPVTSYLSVPKITEYDTRVFKLIRSILKQKGLTTAPKISEYFQETQMRLKKSGQNSIFDGNKFVEVADEIAELVILADHQPNLTSYTVSFYIKIVEYFFVNIEAINRSQAPVFDGVMFKYLKRYGKSKFTSLFNHMMANYEEELKNFKTEKEIVLDALIASQDETIEEAQGALDDCQLTQLASEIDLLASKFDSKKMLEVARKQKSSFPIEKKCFMYLWRFIDEYCTDLLFTLKKPLDIINMVRLLSPNTISEASLPQRLIKLNEYGRICNQAIGLDTREKVKERLRERILLDMNESSGGHLSRFFKKSGHCT